MSAMCQKQTFCAAAELALFDHLVGPGEQGRRDCYAERRGRFEVDHQFEFCRSLYWKVGRFLAPENAIDVAGRTPVGVDRIGAIGDQSAAHNVLAQREDRGQTVPCCQSDDQVTLSDRQAALSDDQATIQRSRSSLCAKTL